MKQAGVIFSSFSCSNRFHIHFPRVDTRLKMDWVLGAFAAEAASYLYTSISHKKISKKEVKQHIHQCDTWRRRSLAHHTARARKYPPNRNAQQAEVRRRCFSHSEVMHTWLVASSKLFMVARNKSSSFLNKKKFPLFSLSDPQGEPCLMGVKRIYRKLKPTSRCVMGKMYSVSMTSGPCDCTEADFEW